MFSSKNMMYFHISCDHHVVFPRWKSQQIHLNICCWIFSTMSKQHVSSKSKPLIGSSLSHSMSLQVLMSSSGTNRIIFIFFNKIHLDYLFFSHASAAPQSRQVILSTAQGAKRPLRPPADETISSDALQTNRLLPPLLNRRSVSVLTPAATSSPVALRLLYKLRWNADTSVFLHIPSSVSNANRAH